MLIQGDDNSNLAKICRKFELGKLKVSDMEEFGFESIDYQEGATDNDLIIHLCKLLRPYLDYPRYINTALKIVDMYKDTASILLANELKVLRLVIDEKIGY